MLHVDPSKLHHYRNLPERGVVSFSGGRTSAYLLQMIVEANGGIPSGWQVIFDNTGFELPETYDFVRRVGEFLGVPITWLEFDSTEPTWVRTVGPNSYSSKGEPFIDLFTHTVAKRRDGTAGLRPLPNPVQRVCTAVLKVKTAHRYLRQHLHWPNRYHAAIGYRADEQDRVDRRLKQEVRYSGNSCPEGGWGVWPMVPAGVTHEDVLDHWSAMPFNLKLEGWEGNCTFCFLKAMWKIKALMVRYPHLVQPWIDLEEMDRDRSNRFRKDRPSLREIWLQVQAGDMTAPPQDPNIICERCTG